MLYYRPVRPALLPAHCDLRRRSFRLPREIRHLGLESAFESSGGRVSSWHEQDSGLPLKRHGRRETMISFLPGWMMILLSSPAPFRFTNLLTGATRHAFH